jgi:hypothetical protein
LFRPIHLRLDGNIVPTRFDSIKLGQQESDYFSGEIKEFFPLMQGIDGGYDLDEKKNVAGWIGMMKQDAKTHVSKLSQRKDCYGF